MNNQDYLKRLKTAIERLHSCEASHGGSIAVQEVVIDGRTLWQGAVEVFHLTGHPAAIQCFAWSRVQGKADEQIVAVLGIPPVNTPEAAVRMTLAADAKAELKKHTDKAQAEIDRRNRLN